MEELLINVASNQGVWATMFIFLFLYQLKENRVAREEAREREGKLTDFISNISKSFEALTKQYDRLSDDVDFIKVEIARHENKK